MSIDRLVSSYVLGAPLMCLVTLVLVAMFQVLHCCLCPVAIVLVTEISGV